MRPLTLMLVVASLLFNIALAAGKGDPENPLLQRFKSPFQVPPFEKIKPGHFLPAITAGLKIQQAQIEAICQDKSSPTFSNTIEALEYSGETLNQIATLFFQQNAAKTNAAIQSAARKISPLLTRHHDNIYLNSRLFKRVLPVYLQRSRLNLSIEQKMLLEETYKRFIRSGAALTRDKQRRLREINTRLSLLLLQFGENLLAETNAFSLWIDQAQDLSGLPQSIIDRASAAATLAGRKGKWLFTLHHPSLLPFLEYADNRALRQKIFLAYSHRGNQNNKQDNKAVIEKMVGLRLEKAQLLGYKSYAQYSLSEAMAKNPGQVYSLLNQLWKPALKMAQKEAAQLQAIINKTGGKFKLAAWDWRYYAEKLRKEKYDLDEESLRPYFKLENVREGLFTIAKKLYGIKFLERRDIPRYHPEVATFEVLDEQGNHLALLFLDFFGRPSKRGGAWMATYRRQHQRLGKRISPIVSLVCNFPRPTAGQPVLLTLEETKTFFHEFGHGLQGMFSKCTYPSLSGTSVPRDFVELSSQILENWLTEPQVLRLFARHHQTGALIPQTLIAKIKKSARFNQGFATTEYLAAAFLDMAYHVLQTPPKEGILAFEKRILDSLGLIPEIISRYRSTYFSHIFAGGYSAGYYSYIWSAVLDTDAFELFKEQGIFNPTVAASFRRNILERGKTEDPMTLYLRFRGQPPQIAPLLKKRGLK